MVDDRSERLRKRRNRSTESQGKNMTSEENNAADPATAPDENGSQVTGQTAASIKEEQIGTYMYLPESQIKEMRRLYNVLKAEYEFEFDEDFEKNRHFYPLIVQHGLDGLDGLDATEIRDRLQRSE